VFKQLKQLVNIIKTSSDESRFLRFAAQTFEGHWRVYGERPYVKEVYKLDLPTTLVLLAYYIHIIWHHHSILLLGESVIFDANRKHIACFSM
jgi:hypothetical protein